MNKIKLDLDALAVESFPTAADESRRVGTVYANDNDSIGHTYCGNTCGGEWGSPCGGYTNHVLTGCTCYCTGVLEPSCDVTCTPSAGEPTCQSGDINC
jgi:hypothetical protein